MKPGILNTYFEIPYETKDLDQILKSACQTSKVIDGDKIDFDKNYDYILSTDNCNIPLGNIVVKDEIIRQTKDLYSIRV